MQSIVFALHDDDVLTYDGRASAVGTPSASAASRLRSSDKNFATLIAPVAGPTVNFRASYSRNDVG